MEVIYIKNKLFYSICIILTLIIILLGCYTTKSCFKFRKNTNNSIYLSPYTGEIIPEHKLKLDCLEVTYSNENNNEHLNGLGNADIIFEYPNSSGRSTYKVIFHSNYPEKINPILDAKGKSDFSVPCLNFKNSLEDKSNFKKTHSIFANFTDFYSSNFIYNDGLYYHFKDKVKEKDPLHDTYISVSNVIVLYVDNVLQYNNPFSIEGKGTGVVFNNGNTQNILWSKEENSFFKLKNENSEDAALSRGKSWWVILDKNTPIIYD